MCRSVDRVVPLCAVAIQKVKSTITYTPNGVNEVINSFGSERAGWVLAAAVERDTTDELLNHKEWASQKELPSEPCNLIAVQDDEHTKIFCHSLIKAVQLKSAVVLWDNGQSGKLSYEDRMAVAKIKANEHNRKITQPTIPTPAQHKPMLTVATPPPPKPKKKVYGMDR